MRSASVPCTWQDACSVYKLFPALYALSVVLSSIVILSWPKVPVWFVAFGIICAERQQQKPNLLKKKNIKHDICLHSWIHFIPQDMKPNWTRMDEVRIGYKKKISHEKLLSSRAPHLTKPTAWMNSLPYSCALNDRSFSGNEAGVEFFYIQTSVLFTCKYKIVSGKTKDVHLREIRIQTEPPFHSGH